MCFVLPFLFPLPAHPGGGCQRTCRGRDPRIDFPRDGSPNITPPTLATLGGLLLFPYPTPWVQFFVLPCLFMSSISEGYVTAGRYLPPSLSPEDRGGTRAEAGIQVSADRCLLILQCVLGYLCSGWYDSTCRSLAPVSGA